MTYFFNRLPEPILEGIKWCLIITCLFINIRSIVKWLLDMENIFSSSIKYIVQKIKEEKGK